MNIFSFSFSSFQQELLSQHSDKQAIIFLNHVSFNQLEALVEYMYKGEINIAQDQISALLVYFITSLKDFIYKFLLMVVFSLEYCRIAANQRFDWRQLEDEQRETKSFNRFG